MKQLKVIAASRNPFDRMTQVERHAFLFDLPTILNGWYIGNAMGQGYAVDAHVETSRGLAIKWGTKAFRKFLDWMFRVQKLLPPHKDTKLYRLVSIPANNKDQFNLKPGKNAIHSWTNNLAAAQFLFKLAYKGRSKKTAQWSYLIVEAKMPGKRIALNYPEVVKLTTWVLRHIDELYTLSGAEGSLFSKKNAIRAWTDLLNRLQTRLIREQQEFICLGNAPLRVKVVERLQ